MEKRTQKYLDFDKKIDKEIRQGLKEDGIDRYPVVCSYCNGNGCTKCDGKGEYNLSVE